VSSLVMPAWVVPTADEVSECVRVCQRRAERGADQRELGVLAALVWLTLGEASPMTWRSEGIGWEASRAESWVALCVAAGQSRPTELDWRRLGVEPKTAAKDDPEFAYGVWRTLAWLLGVREDWPTYTAWHRVAGLARPRPHLDVPAPNRDSDAWRAADQAAREQAQSDALRYWRHVRRLADATAGG
jgi:hypothetical protein